MKLPYLITNPIITTSRHQLTQVLKQGLRDELVENSFITTHLNKLLEKEYYITMTIENLTINYIPIAGITQEYIKQIITRLISIAHYFNIKDKIVFWLLLCNIKRSFPTNGELFGYKHINGGYTYNNKNKIYIFRLENFEKVAIHELLHKSVLDRINFTQLDLLTLKKALSIDTETTTYFRPEEAIVEAWSIIFHLHFLSIENNKPFKDLFKEELEHSLSVSKRQLQYQEEHFPVWKENTNAYAYIRLKTCILYHWNKFIKITYPYKSNEIVAFFLDYNNKPSFIKKIKNALLKSENSYNSFSR